MKQGRLPSLMALVLFTFIVYLALYFKERPINWKIIFIGLVYTVIILTHQAETILAGLFLIGLILIKKNKERIMVISSILLGIILSSFWLIEFIRATRSTSFLQIGFSKWLLDFNSYLWNNVAGIAISLGLFLVFFIYYNQNKNKKEILFFLPVLILNSLFLFRIVLFTPLLKYIYPDPWQDFFTFFLALFLVSINYERITQNLRKSVTIFLILICGSAVIYNVIVTPYFQEWTETDKDLTSLIPELDSNGRFLMFTDTQTSYSRAYYSYAAIYFNKSSSSGWGDMYKEFAYTDSLNKAYREYVDTESCDSLNKLNQEFNTTEILAQGHYCQSMQNCGLKVKTTQKDTCILSYPTN